MKSKKTHLSRIIITFILLLFALCFTMNAFFCATYDLSEWKGNVSEVEIRTIFERIAATDIVAVPIECSPVPFFILVLLFLFLTLFVILPDRWTLISRKVRLDN